MTDLKTYPVLSPVLYDRRYEIGETIDLDDATATSLKTAGAIGEETGTASTPSTSGKPPTAAEQIEKIKAAATEEEVLAIQGDDKRATVVAAAEARKAELAQG